MGKPQKERKKGEKGKKPKAHEKKQAPDESENERRKKSDLSA